MQTIKIAQYAILLFTLLFCAQSFQCTNNCLVCATPTTCSQCALQFFLAPVMNCLKCPLGCLQCVSLTYCQSCLPGYSLANNQCQACTKYCLDCSTPSSCDSCINGFYLSNNTCEVCSEFCLNCNSTLSCSQCAVGYGFNLSSNKCQYCNLSYCLNCQIEGNQTTCLSCGLDYFVNGSICSECPPGCLQCKDKSGKCTQCFQFFYPDQNSGQCIRCQPNECQTCINATYCTKCAVGYLDEIDNETITCSPCQTFCQQCINQTSCQICTVGYYITQQLSCQPCSAMCLQCASQNNCSQCMLGSYLNPQNMCMPCPEQCAVCASPTQCTQCISQTYYFNGSFCLQCEQVIPNCMACYKNKCIECDIGYDVVAYQCQDNTTSIAAIWIVLIIISLLAILGGIGFGIYTWWRRRQGFMGPLGGEQGSGLRASYYQVP